MLDSLDCASVYLVRTSQYRPPAATWVHPHIINAPNACMVYQLIWKLMYWMSGGGWLTVVPGPAYLVPAVLSPIFSPWALIFRMLSPQDDDGSALPSTPGQIFAISVDDGTTRSAKGWLTWLKRLHYSLYIQAYCFETMRYSSRSLILTCVHVNPLIGNNRYRNK